MNQSLSFTNRTVVASRATVRAVLAASLAVALLAVSGLTTAVMASPGGLIPLPGDDEANFVVSADSLVSRNGESAPAEALASASMSSMAVGERYLDVKVTLKNASSRACVMVYPGDFAFGAHFCAAAGVTNIEIEFEDSAPEGAYRVAAYEHLQSQNRYTDDLWWNEFQPNNARRSLATPVMPVPLGDPKPLVTFNFSGKPWLGTTASEIQSLSASPSPLLLGQNGTYSTTVRRAGGGGTTPTGIVEFFNMWQFLGDATLSGGQGSVQQYVGYADAFLEVYYRGNSTYLPALDDGGIALARSISAVAPGYSSFFGGGQVNVYGVGLTGATSVTFDGAGGTDLSVIDDTWVQVIAPEGTNPAAEVVVHGPDWSTTVTDAAFYAYMDGQVGTSEPIRIADVSSFSAGQVRCFTVSGLANVPYGAAGVIVNVTAANAAAGGFVSVFADTYGFNSTVWPGSSTVNFEKGRSVANAAFVELPDNGDICAYSQGGTLNRLIIDVTGYVLPSAGLNLVEPARLLDTRTDFPSLGGGVVGRVAANTTYTVQVTGEAGVPSDAVAVIANVTAVNPTAGGHLRMWEADTTMPTTSVVNYAVGRTKANAQIIALSDDGELSFASFTGNNSPVNVIIDVVGYVTTGSSYNATEPTRIVETRASQGGPTGFAGALIPNQINSIEISDSIVPLSATAVVLNVTAVGPTAGGYAVAYPDTNGGGTTPAPLASHINYIVGRAIPNLVVVQLPTNRTINVVSVQGSTSARTHMVIDVLGYIE